MKIARKCFLASLAVAPALALAGLSPDQPIGVFDSGTGGLTVLETLLAADAFDNVTGEQSPDGKPDFSSERFVYFGDQANMPYGVYDAEGKADFLRELVVRDARFVLGGDRHAPAKIVVIACNTATAYGLKAATEVARPGGVKVIGVVNAGVAATLDALKAKIGMAPFAVGVMATPGTIASGVYERTLRAAFAEKRIDSFEIVNRGGVGLAEAVENDEPGMRDCARTNFTALVESYRARGGKAPIRAVILGCTHYPFVLSVFRETLAELRRDPAYRGLLADDLVFVDPAVYTAIQCFSALKKDGLLNSGGGGGERVKAFMSVGRNGPLSYAEKYGRSVGQADIGTVIVPMTRKTMTPDSVRRLEELLPASAAAIFPKAGPTFLLPFEGTCTAAKAGGAAEPTAKPIDVTFGPGITGQAAHFGKGAGYLHYTFAGNAAAERGTVSFWYKPDAAMPDWPRLRAPLFHFDHPAGVANVFNGTGWINLLIESGNLQARFGTDRGGGEWVSARVWNDPSWRHIAISWDRDKGIVRLCVDGEECVKRGDSYNPFKPPYGGKKWSNPQQYKGFVVGGERRGGTSCAGWLDDFAIHGEVLPMEEIRAAAVAHKPLAVSLARHFAWAGGGGEIEAAVTNRSGAAVTAQAVFKAPDGAEIARREVTVPARGAASVKAKVEKFAAGRYVVEVSAPGKVGVSTEFWTLGAQPTHIAEGDGLQLEKVFEADFSELPPADRIVSNSENFIRELDGRRYIETSPKHGSRFAYRVDLPVPNALYCFEWEWPDDKPRFADVIVQPATAGHNHYELQVGYATGGPLWPISGKMQTVRQLYWASSTNCAVVLCTLKANEPAAVASLKVHRVKGDALPAARRVREVPRAADGGRVFGLYFEDPAIGLCFNIPGIGGDMPGFENLVNRTVAYLKHTGQNFMSYPGVWYHGLIGKDYQPRAHMIGYLEAWYERFDREGFGFMPSVNLHTVPFTPHVPVNAVSVADGTFNGTCADIVDDGSVASKWHHQPPTYNGLHPHVQAEIDKMVDALLAEGAPHPSFKGIDFYFHTAHDLPWLGTIHAGYNDWAIDAFSRDTGIKPPVDRADPERGRKYAEWLKANAYEQWVAWRSKMFAAWVRRMAKRIAAVRGDLQLCITAQSLIEYEKQDPATPHLQTKLMREGALDSELLADIPNLVLRLGCRPLGPQASRGKTSTRKEEVLLMNAEYTPEYWEPLKAAREPQLNIHDHYYESAMGSKTPLKAPWFRETGWRVCAINPLGRNAMKAYIDPFKYGDVLGITRGGFLIATYGLEPMMIPFAKAYTALPRKRFKDVEACSTETVKVRRLSDGGHSWVYAVNTGAEPAKVSLPCGRTQVVDLATGLPAKEWRNGRLELSLAPYEFRAFVR